MEAWSVAPWWAWVYPKTPIGLPTPTKVMEEAKLKTRVDGGVANPPPPNRLQDLSNVHDPLTEIAVAVDWHVVSVFVATEPSHVEAAL